MNTKLLTEYEHVIVGAGAAGMAVAKLISLSNNSRNTVLLEQHFSPGGCASYFARGFPKRIYDVGATQLVGVRTDEIQYKLFVIGGNNLPDLHKIEKINFYFPEDHSLISIDSNNNIQLENGSLILEEIVFLQKVFSYATRLSHSLWNTLRFSPKFPFYCYKEVISNIKILTKIKYKFFVLLSLFINTNFICRFLGMKKEYYKSKYIINSLLLDTVQNKMDRVPWVFGSMGLSIIHYGIFKFKDGMRSYFYNLSIQIQKNGLNIFYQYKLCSITENEKGFILEILNLKNKIKQNILVTDNLFLNISIYDFLNIYKEKNSYKNKLKKILKYKNSWTAFALYGYIKDINKFSAGPHYFQIFFENNELKELKSSLYVSISETKNKIRVITATIHINLSEVNDNNFDIYKNRLITRIEMSLGIEILSPEFASQKTFEKYTAREKGRVGGLIINSLNTILKPIPNFYHHKNKKAKIFLIGDCYFPGQGIISSSVSGINAWERAFHCKFSQL